MTTSKNLKIEDRHYSLMEAAIKVVLEAHPGIEQQYREAGYSSMRLNWDLLRASQIEGKGGVAWISDNLYSYLNDSHINSALKAIVGNDGLSTKQLVAKGS